MLGARTEGYRPAMSDPTLEDDQDSEPTTQAPEGEAPTDTETIQAANDDPDDDRGAQV